MQVNLFLKKWCITSIVIGITAFLTPGFSISGGIISLFISALAIIVLDTIVQNFTNTDTTPFKQGTKSFFLAALVLYLAKFIVPNFHIGIIGAFIAAFILGIVDSIIPGRKE